MTFVDICFVPLSPTTPALDPNPRFPGSCFLFNQNPFDAKQVLEHSTYHNKPETASTSLYAKKQASKHDHHHHQLTEVIHTTISCNVYWNYHTSPQSNNSHECQCVSYRILPTTSRRIYDWLKYFCLHYHDNTHVDRLCGGYYLKTISTIRSPRLL